MKTFGILLGAAILVAGLPALSQEEGATSVWSRADHSSLRLIAGPTAASGKQRVGVEILLAPGFKTYWRNPGDSGVPPVFDWSGSTNIAGLDVRWPVPERFADAAGSAIGYAGEIVIPVSVSPLDPAQPVMLMLKLDYAVCDKMCIPAKGETQLRLEPGVTHVTSARLKQFEARVPVPVRLGEQRDQLSIAEALVEDGTAGLELAFTLRMPAGGKVDDIFVEGPGMWAFGKPGLTIRNDGSVLARIALRERPKAAGGPIPFIVTLRGLPGPTETRLELDIPSGRP